MSAPDFDPHDPRADLTQMTAEQIREWRATQEKRSSEQFPDPPRGPFSREKGRINATWPTELWDFPLTPGSLCQLTSNSTEPRLTRVHGLRHVDDAGPIAVLVSDHDGLLALRHRHPSGSWGHDVRATSVQMPSPNILLPVHAWAVPSDTDPLPAPIHGTIDLVAQTKGVHGQP